MSRTSVTRALTAFATAMFGGMPLALRAQENGPAGPTSAPTPIVTLEFHVSPDHARIGTLLRTEPLGRGYVLEHAHERKENGITYIGGKIWNSPADRAPDVYLYEKFVASTDTATEHADDMLLDVGVPLIVTTEPQIHAWADGNGRATFPIRLSPGHHRLRLVVEKQASTTAPSTQPAGGAASG